MKTNLLSKPFLFLFLIIALAYSSTAFAQTPGLIYRPATAGGAKVLDPNGDGYVSVRPTGFTGSSDEGASNSEIPYRPFPALTTEPLGDLNTGASGSHTDLVPPATPLTSPSTGSPFSAYYSGNNLLIRARLGGSSTASKGYSVLIDADQTFNGSGTNPGFEYEVLLASNFSVQVIRHSPTGSSSVIFNGSVDQYAQKAVAASTAGGNTDYFYDFYVPLSAFGGGITADTPLRMSGITVTSAQSGITGTVSDIGGVNFQAYNYNAPAAWRALINGFPATSLNQLNTSGFAQIAAAAPFITGPIAAGSTSITGTSVEAAGSTVTIFRNGNQIGTATVAANGTWTLSGLASNSLSVGNSITATVTAAGKRISPTSNTVTVTASALCTTIPAPVLTGQSNTNNKYATGTTSYVGRQLITLYTVDPTVSVLAYYRQGSYVFTSTSSGQALPTSNITVVSGTVTLTKTGNYVVTTTPVDANNNPIGCESLKSNQICFQNGGSAPANNFTPTISSVTSSTGTIYNTLSEAPANISSITGTLSSYAAGGSRILLFKNGELQSATATPSATSPFTWTLTGLQGLTLNPGDVLNVRTEASLSCGLSLSSASNLITIRSTTATPTINAITTCGPVRAVTGTSEEPGSVVTIFTNGTSTGLTGIVNANGYWAVNLSSLNSGTGVAAGTPITARAKTAGKATSLVSSAVQSTPAPTGVLVINTPIAEGTTTISGTGPASAAGAEVTLYIEGTPFPTPVLVASDGSWTVSRIAPQEIFAGSSVSATFKPSGGCESAKATPVTVTCSLPSVAYTLSSSPSTICGGSTASITLSGSEYGVSYGLLVNGTQSGSSVIGTGGPIVLTSGAITNITSANTTTTFTYRARKISGTTCEATSSNTTSVTVRPQPVTSGLSYASTTQSICANANTTFSLNGTNAGYNYQLVNEATNELVGSSVQGSGNSNPITLATGDVRTNTTFGLRVSIRSADLNAACGTTLPSQVTVNISSPSTTRAVYPENPKTCVGGATRINVSTEPNNDFEYAVYRRASSTNNLTSDLLLGTFRGNGVIQSVTTGPLNTAGTETFYVTVRRVTNSTCGTLTLQNTAQVEVTNNPLQPNAGSDVTICASSYVLKGNDVSPGIGNWSQVSGPNMANFSSTTSPTATVSGLISGTYVLAWTVQTTCGNIPSSTTDEVIIRVNCDAFYTLSVPRYSDEYRGGEVLAFATDPDATIISATVTQGTVPLGVGFSTTTGEFTVLRPLGEGIVEGIYNLSIRLTDRLGGTTTVPITLRLYGESPAIVPLPVELVYFTALVDRGQVILQWLTASEENNKEFVVERSTDGESFESIATVAGAGTSSQPQRYHYTDTKPLPGTTYYRLKQVDYDGRTAYSRVVDANLNENKLQTELEVWPNPFDQEINLTIAAPASEEASVVLTDLKGQEVYSGKVQLTPGVNELSLPIRGLSTGMYILRLQGNGVSGTAKILKK